MTTVMEPRKKSETSKMDSNKGFNSEIYGMDIPVLDVVNAYRKQKNNS